MISTVKDYEQPEDWFRTASALRAPYISAVDEIVMSKLQSPWLDVGSGDGVRAMSMAIKKSIGEFYLTDPVEDMHRLSDSKTKNHPNGASIKVAAENLIEHFSNIRFKTITCLWSALGVIPKHDNRVRAIENMAALLDKSGVIVLDINHRYNLRQYGLMNFIRNLAADLFSPSTKNGDFEHSADINGITIDQKTHFFSPREVETLFKNAGLRILQRLSVDYNTGERKRLFINGQLVYILSK